MYLVYVNNKYITLHIIEILTKESKQNVQLNIWFVNNFCKSCRCFFKYWDYIVQVEGFNWENLVFIFAYSGAKDLNGFM